MNLKKSRKRRFESNFDCSVEHFFSHFPDVPAHFERRDLGFDLERVRSYFSGLPAGDPERLFLDYFDNPDLVPSVSIDSDGYFDLIFDDPKRRRFFSFGGQL